MSTDTNAAALPRCTVRAFPAPGVTHRWRAGRAWGKDPVTCEIVAEPEFVKVPGPLNALGRPSEVLVPHPTRITAADVAALQRDPMIACIVGADQAAAQEAVALKEIEANLRAKLSEREQEIARLAEERAARDALAQSELDRQSARLAEQEAEIANLRAQLGDRTAKAARR